MVSSVVCRDVLFGSQTFHSLFRCDALLPTSKGEPNLFECFKTREIV